MTKQKKYEESLEVLNKASDLLPEVKESYAYKFLAHISQYLSLDRTEQTFKSGSLRCMKSARAEIDMALAKAKKNADLHYYKGILELAQSRYTESLQEFLKTIKYADDSTARDYFAKGLAEAFLGLFKEAVEDLEITIKLDPCFADAYLLKGKCMYLLGDLNGAFASYQQLIMASKNDPLMHVHAGNLIMASGRVEDSIDAFNNANKVEETSVAYYQQTKVSARGER